MAFSFLAIGPDFVAEARGISSKVIEARKRRSGESSPDLVDQFGEKQVSKQNKIQPNFKVNELRCIVSLVPITDRTLKADMPVEGEEQYRTVVEVCENVNNRVNHTAEDEGQPPVSARADFVHEAPEKNSVDDEGSWRMQEVVTGNPPGIGEIRGVDDIFHQGTCILLENDMVVNIRSPRQQAKGNIGQYRTPQKCGFSEFESCAIFLFDGSIDDKMGRDGVQCWLQALCILVEMSTGRPRIYGRRTIGQFNDRSALVLSPIHPPMDGLMGRGWDGRDAKCHSYPR